MKNKEQYFKALEFTSSKKQKLREIDFEKLDKIAFQWFASKRSENIPHNGDYIKEKALTYAKELGYGDFQASDGWLNRSKRQ